jgi:hypothetical protein
MQPLILNERRILRRLDILRRVRRLDELAHELAREHLG